MLRIAVLGGLALTADERPLPLPRAAPARALLARLALVPGSHPRSELAACLWPDVLDESARQSLRNALYGLRRDLGPAHATAVRSTGDALELDGGAVVVDAWELDATLRRGDVAAAVALAEAGPLLRGFDQEWAVMARDELRERVSAALAGLAAGAADDAAAIAWARRRVRLDPLSEEAARDLVQRLAGAGDRAAALATYERLAERLRRELRVAPSGATRALADELRAEAPPAGLPRADVPGRAASPLPRPLALCGRGAELGALIGAWSAARAARGSVVVLEGEAGIGKSRLVAELADRVTGDGGRLAVGASIALEGAAPLAPWAELLDGLLDDLATDRTPTWAPDLAALAPAAAARLGATVGAGPGRADLLRLHEAVVAALGAAAARGPVLVVLEDLHFADQATLALLAHAGRRVRGLRVLVVVTRRPGGPDAVDRAVDATVVTLPPLRSADTEGLVRTAAARLDPAAVARIAAAADGNPLLAVESARAVAAGHPGPAPSLRAAVRDLLAGLSPPARELADLLAAAGRALDSRAVDALPLADVAAAADQALAAGVLEARDGALDHRHALLRDAAYAELSPPRRRVLHRRIADALVAAGGGRDAEVAQHLRRAGDDDRAVDHLAAAARAARDVVALDEARGYLDEALALRPDEPELLLLRGHVEALRGDRDAMFTATGRALTLLGPGDRRGRARVLARRGQWLSSALCWPAEALADLREARDLLAGEGVSPDERTAVLGALAWAEAVAGDPDQVEPLLAEAQALRAPDRHGLHAIHAVSARLNACVRSNRAADALALADELEDATRGSAPGWPALLGNTVWLELASVAAFAGRHERALAFTDTFLAQQGPLVLKRLEGLAARAYVLTRLGRADEAIANAEEMVALADEVDDGPLALLARYDLGRVLCSTGAHERGVAELGGALRGGVKAQRAGAWLQRAESLVLLGRVEEARRDVRAAALEAVTPADQPETLVPRLARAQARIAHATGDEARARALLEEAAAGWRHLVGTDPHEAYLSNLIDLGRPPVAGLTEPARELALVETELEELRGARL